MKESQNERVAVFIIPNYKLEGAQNFFRRVHENIELNHKHLIVEEGQSLIKNLFKVSSLGKAKNLTIFSTVNSNKIGLIFKIIQPSSRLVMRLGNTISLEIKKYSSKYFFHKFFYFISILLCQNFIFQSNLMKNDFIKFFKFKDNAKFLVIYNGVSKADFSGTQNLPFPKDRVNFLLVGSFKRQKGYDILLACIQAMSKETRGRLHLHICGDGDEFQMFKKDLFKYSLESIVSLYGHIPPDAFYQQSDVYVLPSRFEGFSNSLIEALSFGLPVIVSDCPSANREVVTQNLNGIFFKNLDHEDLLKNICYMLDHYKRFNKDDIIRDTQERFSLTSVTKIYKGLIKS